MTKDGQDERFEPKPYYAFPAGFAENSVLHATRLLYRVTAVQPRILFGSMSMNEVNLSEAFSRYHVKTSTRARSAVTADRALVLSCLYARFQRADAGIMKYEEDLSGDVGVTTNLLRTHLADALENELEVRLIVAVTKPIVPSVKIPPQPSRSPRSSFHAREDLVGRVTFFDGQRFVVEFRKNAAPVMTDRKARLSRQKRANKGAVPEIASSLSAQPPMSAEI
jgi:hypothetical protein